MNTHYTFIQTQDFKDHTAQLISKLRQDYEEGAESINQHMSQASTDKKLSVVLKVTAGSHIGQKFRLEPTTVSTSFVTYTVLYTAFANYLYFSMSLSYK